MASAPRSLDPDMPGPRIVFANVLLISNRHSNYYQTHIWSTEYGRTVSNRISPVILCFTPIFLNLLQLKYGGAGPSPYRTHPVTMGFSIACLIAGCIAYLLKNVYLPDSSLRGVYGQALERATLSFGSLALASLATLLLPSSWTTYSYVVYIFLTVGVGALLCAMVLKFKPRTSSSESGTARGHLLLSGASSVDQEIDLPV